MIFKVIKSSISPAINMVSGAISSRVTIPILETIQFAATEDTLTLTATDYDVLAVSKCAIEGDDKVVFHVEAKLIKEALLKMPNQELEFSISDKTLLITYNKGKGKLSIPIEMGNLFSNVNSQKDLSVVKIDSMTLKNGLSKCSKFMSEDDFKPTLRGVYFRSNKEGVTFAATDAFKMCVISSKQDSQNCEMIIPKKAINIIHSNLTDTEHECVIKSGDGFGVVYMPVGMVHFRLPEGRFPSFDSIISAGYKESAKVDKNALLGAVERARPFSSIQSGLVRISGGFMDMSIEALDLDLGRSMSEVITIDGDMNTAVGMKAKNIIDCLSCIDGDDLTLGMTSESSPLYIESKEEGIVMLVMPMK